MRLLSSLVTESPAGGGRARITGRIAFADPSMSTAELWFDVPDSCAELLSDNGNPWLAALLPLAARLGEPIELPLPVDRRLHAGALQVLRTWHGWYPETTVVPIEAEALTEHTTAPGKRTAAFFSGGVDSFFSVIEYDAANPTAAIDDLIAVWGFDIPLDNAAGFDRMRASLARAADAYGKNLVDVTTNIRDFLSPPCNWASLAHGAALAATALILEPRYARTLVPSTVEDARATPWGSHAQTDPLFSTSGLEIVHHGADHSRTDKTARIADSPIARDTLRVCWKSRSDHNCGKCEKCYRTMLTLHLLGALDCFRTFGHVGFDLRKMGWLYSKPETNRIYLEDIQALATRLGRADVVAALDASFRRSDRLQRYLRIIAPLSRQRLVWRLYGPLRDAAMRRFII
jgi:hypothetical protein